MGLKPSDYAMLAGMVGGPLLGGMFAPDAQERQSFEGSGVDPKTLMLKNQAMLDEIMPLIMGRANAGVSLPSAYVQQPGAYTGGGMPMPVGLVASDPALSNPNLLKIPGLGFNAKGTAQSPGGIVDGIGTLNPPGAGFTPADGFDPDTGAPLEGFDDFGLPQFDQRTPENPNGTTDGLEPTPRNQAEKRGGPRRRGDTQLFAEGDLINPGDDLQQALGSVDLLLQAFGGGQRV